MKKRVIKTYKRNKRSKSRKKTRKRLKMVGGSIYDTETAGYSTPSSIYDTETTEYSAPVSIYDIEPAVAASIYESDLNVELSKENYKLQTQLAEVNQNLEREKEMAKQRFGALQQQAHAQVAEMQRQTNSKIEEFRDQAQKYVMDARNQALQEVEKDLKRQFEAKFSEADADWASRVQRYADKLKICEQKLQAQTNKPNRFRKSSQRDFQSDLNDTKKMLAELQGEVQKQHDRKLPEGTFWLGSTEEEVLSILGSPTSLDDYGSRLKHYSYKLDSRSYITDNITFENGRVTSYRNDSGRLPISCGIERIPGGKITIGSTEEEVLSILGSPTSIDDYGSRLKHYSYKLDSRSYITDNITFENGRVTSYRNDSGRLPISLQKTTPIPHAETTLEYHQRELGRMEREDTLGSGVKISPTATLSVEDYKVDQEVMYISKTGNSEQKATIVKIYRNIGPGEEPFIDIKLNSGIIRQTVLDRIRPI
jgi:hypothetical protein